MTKWDYETVEIKRNHQNMKSVLTKMGDKGWELCAFWELKSEGNPFNAIFKRKRKHK